MAVNDETKTAINDAIKAIYAADVSAIQNLSDIANKLQTGGYTCPGDFSVTGVLKVKTRDILSEIDINNYKTNHIWTNDNATFFMKEIHVDGNIVAKGLIKTEGNLFGEGLLIGGKNVLGTINERLNALEAKCGNISANANGISHMIFTNGIIMQQEEYLGASIGIRRGVNAVMIGLETNKDNSRMGPFIHFWTNSKKGIHLANDDRGYGYLDLNR
jgi:hypothetical protein